VQDNDEEGQHHYDTARLEAFSDGVIAIAITLLVLEIAVPHVTDGSLASALRDEWPSFFGFGLSFVTIGIMWMNHHGLFRDIERAIICCSSSTCCFCLAFLSCHSPLRYWPRT
jgi:uncharacterized membrane protein